MLKKWIFICGLVAWSCPAWSQDDGIDFSAEEEVVEEFGEFDDADFSDAGGDAGSFEDFGESEIEVAQPQDSPTNEAPADEFQQEIAQPEDNIEPLEPSGEDTLTAEPTFETSPEAPAEFNEPQAEPPPTLLSNTPLWDEPDLELEAKLYDIYINYHSKPVSDAEWNKLLGERTVENYVIQRNDTLWDISQTLFGDGNYWPKIWSLNDRITNPHLIQPKNTIRFYLGDETGPPAFTVTESEAPETEDETVSESEPELPPPSVRSRPVVKKLPPSLPQWQDPVSVNQSFDEMGIDYGKRKIADVIDSIPLSSYVAEDPPLALGRVEEIETGHNIAASLQYVYVTVTDGGDIGDTYLAVYDRGPIQVRSKHIDLSVKGRGIEVLGEIQLVEKVKGENEDRNGRLYRALVTKIVNPVQVGAVLTQGRIENMDLTENGPRSQVVAQIVGGQLFNQRQVYAPESIAYLNRGENDGLQVGQILPVRANRKLRNEKSIVLGNVRSIGWLKIVRTTPNMATAVILRSWSDILAGDLTGAGDYVPNAVSTSNGLEDATQTSLLQELGEDSSAPEHSQMGDDFGEDNFGDEDVGGEGSGDEEFDDADFGEF